MTSINDYLKEVEENLAALLQSQKNALKKDEKSIQSFFEEYPTALLAAIDDAEASYSIYCGIVISQPRFKSLERDRQPDFLIVTSNSLNLYFNFIELEDPSKKIFNIKGQRPSAHFFEAFNQLRQWSSYDKNEVQNYCNNLLNTLFNDNNDSRTHKKHHYNFILVHGFSDEVKANGASYNHLLQDYFKEKNLLHSTYSRIMQNIKYSGKLISVKKNATGKFKAIGLTPFKRYSYDEWWAYHNIIDKDLAISSNKFLEEREKIDLINQIQSIDKKTIQQIMDEQFKNNGLNIRNFGELEI